MPTPKILLFLPLIAFGACTCSTTVKRAKPSVVISPDRLDFDIAPVGAVTPNATPITLLALTQADVTLSDVHVEGDGAAAFTVEKPVAQSVPGNGTAMIQVDFAPTSTDVFAAVLVIATDDADHPTTRIALSGTGGLPKVSVLPDHLSLSARACPANSNMPICEAHATVAVANAGAVRLDLSKIEFAPGAAGLSLPNALSLSPLEKGGSISVTVSYRPTAAGDATAKLRIVSSDPATPEVFVPITLHADPDQPPIACLAVTQVTRRKYVCADTACSSYKVIQETVDPKEWGDPHAPRVRPGSTVSLTADANLPGCSADPEGDALAYTWTLGGSATPLPQESRAQLQSDSPPSGRPADAYKKIEIDAAGHFAVGLHVADSIGLGADDTLIIDAIPRDDIAVELAWGKDPTTGTEQDTLGIDLDLHLLAPGGKLWCTLDCFWDNPNPAWPDVADPNQHPRLLRDDTGTAVRLENTVLTTAQAGATYQVLVYYFTANGGASSAVPSVIVRTCPPTADGSACVPSAPLTFNAPFPLTTPRQYWQAATITWPSKLGDQPTVTAGSQTSQTDPFPGFPGDVAKCN